MIAFIFGIIIGACMGITVAAILGANGGED